MIKPECGSNLPNQVSLALWGLVQSHKLSFKLVDLLHTHGSKGPNNPILRRLGFGLVYLSIILYD